MLHDPEEEHDCFSDNTHNSPLLRRHRHPRTSISAATSGIDGSVVEGPSVSDLVAEADPALDAELRARSTTRMAALGAIKTVGEAGTHYDQLLATGNADRRGDGDQAAVDALVAQTRSIERAVAALELDDDRLRGLRQPRQPGRGVPVAP